MLLVEKFLLLTFPFLTNKPCPVLSQYFIVLSDINECTEKNNPCRKYQSCQNSYGSYSCIDSINCGPGFEVGRDGKTCIGIFYQLNLN